MGELFSFVKLTSVYATLANKIPTCVDDVGIRERMLPHLTAIFSA